MSSPAFRGVAAVAAAFAIALASGCGGDDESDTPASTGTTDGEVSEQPEVEPAPAEEDAGDEGAPVISDEQHEGAGPDPGTEEAEQVQENAESGGTSAGDAASTDEGGGNAGGGSGGTGPTGGPEAFEQFCEENPEACE